MKLLLCLAAILSFTICGCWGLSSHLPDMPAGGNRPANLLQFPVGSLIIDMGDRQIENTWVNQQAVNGLFNLQAYGYAVRLLHANIPLYWAIKSNKAKDDVDFWAWSYRLLPTGYYSGSSDGPWGSTTPAHNSFRGGPLIISANYSQAALQVLATMQTQQHQQDGSTSSRAYSIVLYNTTQPAVADIRHKLTHKPYIAISTLSNDSFNWGPHPWILQHAGFIQGTLETGGHYVLVDSSAALESFNAQTCFTMFSEPHVIYDSSASCPRCVQSSIPIYAAALKKFISAGGNFLTQCAGVGSYENSGWASQYHPESGVEGIFMSSGGFKGLGNHGNEWKGRSQSNLVNYPNPDVPLAQFVGDLAGNISGTITEWYLLPANVPDAQLFKNSAFSLAENGLTGAAFRATEDLGICTVCNDTSNNLLPDGKTAYISTVAKLSSTNVGGLVVYLGSHSWFADLEAPASSSYASGHYEYAQLYNGRRIYLNTILTPSTRPLNCSLSFCPSGGACPSDIVLGSCQACYCQNNQPVVYTDATRCTGTCESCDGTNCIPSDSHCDTNCQTCSLNSATNRYDCTAIPGNSCGNSDTAKLIGGLVGGLAGGLAALAVLAALGAAAGAIIWRHFKSASVPTEDLTGTIDNADADSKGNPMFLDTVTVTENQLAA